MSETIKTGYKYRAHAFVATDSRSLVAFCPKYYYCTTVLLNCYWFSGHMRSLCTPVGRRESPDDHYSPVPAFIGIRYDEKHWPTYQALTTYFSMYILCETARVTPRV